MKRRLTAAALVLIFPLSMAACGSQSTADACQELATARTSVHQYSAEHSILDMPIDEVPDHLKKLLDMYRDAGKKVSNKEVKDVLDPYVESLDKLKDMDPAGAMSGDTEYSAAVSDASTKANALASLCGISNGLNK